MSDDEADPELLELLRQSLGISRPTHGEVSSDTGVLKDAEFIYNNAIDVLVDMYGTKAAAAQIYKSMQEKSYSTETWSEHELHPKMSEGFLELDIVNFVFTMDLLNFSFWSELSNEERFQVEYRGKRWTGYNSLVASLRRALDERIPMTTPRFWRHRHFTEDALQYVFRSATAEPIPLLEQRFRILREAGDVLCESFGDESDDEDALDGAEDELNPHRHTPAVRVASLQEHVDAGHGMDVDGAVNEPQHSGDLHGANGATTEHADIVTDPATSPTQSTVFSVEDQASQAAANGGHSSTVSDRPDGDPGSGHTDNQISAGIPSHHDLHQNDNPDSTRDANTTSNLRSEAINEAEESQGDIANASVAWQVELKPDHAVARLIQRADQSAGKLVNLLAKYFDCFRDETRFDGKRVRLLKRAQIFVADLWAALNQKGLGEFGDIGHLTMFADYRVPQSLHSLGVLSYSPPLDYHLRNMRSLASGHSWEVQLRGCSIWSVELIRREIVKEHPDAANTLNAVLIDFFLYDLAKERESEAIPSIPHQRVRSVWY